MSDPRDLLARIHDLERRLLVSEHENERLRAQLTERGDCPRCWHPFVDHDVTGCSMCDACTLTNQRRDRRLG